MTTPPRKSSRDGERSREEDGKLAGMGSLGLQFVLSILGGLYAGQWLDRRWRTAPWCLVLGVFLGGGLTFYSMYRRLAAMSTTGDGAMSAGQDRSDAN